MILTFEQRHSAGHRACQMFGGDSSSASSSTTNNTDMRVVGGDGSTNLSTQNSGSGTINVMATDQGAIKAGMTLASQAIDANTHNTGAVLDTTAQIYNGALGAVTDANQRLALAYQSGQAGDQTQLKYAGFIVVGLAVAMFFKRN